MAILSSTDSFFTQFEPKQPNRFLVKIDGIPSYMVKGMSALTLDQGKVPLNYINVVRNVKGKSVWGDVTFTMFDPITPSGAQSAMEWVRLGHESVTGRDGYSDFYKKDLEFNALGPVNDIVSSWTLKGAFITNLSMGEYSWDTTDAAVSITMTCAIDFAVLNY